MKIIVGGLVLAGAWTMALFIIARSVGLHSTPGMWAGAIGLPGVVMANWAQANLFRQFNHYLGYGLMFLINWVFYCSVIQGILSFVHRVSNRP